MNGTCCENTTTSSNTTMVSTTSTTTATISTSEPAIQGTINDNDRCHTVQLIRYPHQVSGHVGLLAYPDENTICKPLNEREFQAYTSFPDELKDFIPRFCGMVKVYFKKRGEDIMCFGLPADCKTCKDEKGLPCYLRSNSEESAGEVMPFEIFDKEDSKRKSLGGESFSGSKSRIADSGEPPPVTESNCDTSPPMKSSSSTTEGNCFSKNRKLSLQDRYTKCTKLEKFIKLECISKHYRFPCIIDLKMGTRGHSDFASKEKRERKEARINNSTSRTLGVRLCGMQVYSTATEKYTFVDKYDGRRFTDAEFKNSLRDFLFNGERHRTELIVPLLRRLHTLREHLQKLEGFRFYCSSLLLMYDGHNGGSNGYKSESINGTGIDGMGTVYPEVEVRMIDFANARLKEEESNPHIGPDHGYIFGVTSLIDILTQLQDSLHQNGTI